MNQNNVEQLPFDTKQQTEKNLQEFISHGTRTKNDSDERTLLVFGALQEKLETRHKAEDKSDIEIQLEKSELHLQDLIEFGNELTNNIKSSNEQREFSRSINKHEKEIELQENLRKEAELSLNQFNEIGKKWKVMKNMKEPMTIHEEMQRQQESIENLMTSKNELIEQCKEELSKVNEKYYGDQVKQAEDICSLVERIDQLINLLKKSYNSSINELQNTIEREKQKILQAGQEKWNLIYEHLTDKEDKKMELVKEKQRLYAQELDNLRNKQEEITRTTKIRLEKDAELLELEIRKTKANILMNSEKIDYNYQVLQKRNEENIIINNQQKRRVAKLNESIVALKKKLIESKRDNKLTMEKLTQDIQKFHDSINDLHVKSEYFRKHNSLKLAKVWIINFKEIKHFVARVFEIDRILYEQQLGRKWIQPNIDLDQLDYTKDFQAFTKAEKVSNVQQKTLRPPTKLTHSKQLQDILYKISDRAGFLIEDRLLKILAPHTEEDKCLVKIENIFSALNITNITEVESLVKYFEPYSWCPNCSDELDINSLKPFTTVVKETNSVRYQCTKNLCTYRWLNIKGAYLNLKFRERIFKQSSKAFK